MVNRARPVLVTLAADMNERQKLEIAKAPLEVALWVFPPAERLLRSAGIAF